MSLVPSDPIAAQAERNQLYEDYYNNIVPKRLPVSMSVGHHILAELGGVDFFDYQFDFSKLAGIAEEICEKQYSDTLPVGGVGFASRPPSYFQLLESQSFKMGAGGFVQHPEVIGMLAEEYDALIEDPYAAILELVLPRQHKALAMDDPVGRGNAVHLSRLSLSDDGAAIGPTLGALSAKYGYYAGAPRGSGGFTAAPYDFLADQLRSFSEVSKDVRRNRAKVIDACDALYPLMFLAGLPPAPHPRGAVGTPLHMPTYMREKDFVEVWLPTYTKMLEQYAARGARVSMFNEHDWMRYLDILQDQPKGHLMRFEYGIESAQLIVDKLAKTHFYGGLYPIVNVKAKSKQENIDAVKALLDIMMPGGGYQFGFDKGAIMASDIPLENYNAIAETIRDYGVYTNAGESFGTPLNTEGFAKDDNPVLGGKYAFNWDEFKKQYPYTPDSARARFENYYNSMFTYYMTLLM
ncbi:MAG: hypothetical protein FWG10_00095 [Eubacteriaceae bacterium]|nr:hypothetical protein [Eubacteriaceae bacterium]